MIKGREGADNGIAECEKEVTRGGENARNGEIC
jgi:hypothetical protein